MISDYIKIGTKMDIMPDDVSATSNEEYNAVFHSMVQDVFENGDLEVDMPTVNGKLILLHNSVRYRMIFYTDKATYLAKAEVVDRYKSNNMFLLRVRILSQLERFQRREYFRCECTLDIKFRSVTEEEANAVDFDTIVNGYDEDGQVPYDTGVALDISGGGIRFTSRRPVENGSLVRIVFSLGLENQLRDFRLIGRVLSSNLFENSKTRYENRIQFTHILSDEREAIIRYIFEQERKSRKLGRG